MSEALVRGTRERVQSWIGDIVGAYEVDDSGAISFREGSAKIFVAVRPFGDDGTTVAVTSLILSDVKKTPALLEWAAFVNHSETFSFFNLSHDETNPDLVHIWCEAHVLGTFLDKDELQLAILSVATSADEKDDELQAEFGGSKWFE